MTKKVGLLCIRTEDPAYTVSTATVCCHQCLTVQKKFLRNLFSNEYHCRCTAFNSQNCFVKMDLPKKVIY